MKEVIALIRPGKAKPTKLKLAEKGFFAYTEERVSGRGKQKGLRYANGEAGIGFLPRRMLTLFVNDPEVGEVLAILAEANRTGEIGDGKIFVCPAENAIRIRTDEFHEAALS